MTSQILYNILQVVVVVASALITRFLIPWINSKTQDTQVQTVIKLIEQLVLGAEQMNATGLVKKEEVFCLINDYCIKHKVNLSADQIDELIESAVYQFNAGKAAA